MMEDLGADPSEIGSIELPEAKWYDAQEGLDWMRKVAEHIRADPSAVSNSKGVLAELDQVKEIGARWHLQVDF